jgi:hypothetical protein
MLTALIVVELPRSFFRTHSMAQGMLRRSELALGARLGHSRVYSITSSAVQGSG